MAYEGTVKERRVREGERVNSKGVHIKNPDYVEEQCWACNKCGIIGIPFGDPCPHCKKFS